MDAAQARREEILAKKAKLEELRRTRALREQEMKKSRQSVGESSEVLYQRHESYDFANALQDCTANTKSCRQTKRHRKAY
jgi:hypothetical protein